MLLPKIVPAMAYGLAWTTSTVPQEQSAAFEYWPVAPPAQRTSRGLAT